MGGDMGEGKGEGEAAAEGEGMCLSMDRRVCESEGKGEGEATEQGEAARPRISVRKEEKDEGFGNIFDIKKQNIIEILMEHVWQGPN